jgi:hypothetical protein
MNASIFLNILEDARHWIGLLQYNLSTVTYIRAFWCIVILKLFVLSYKIIFQSQTVVLEQILGSLF